MVRSLEEQMYITTLAQQVLYDLMDKHPHLRHPEMSMDLIYEEKRNDFFNDFVWLCAACECTRATQCLYEGKIKQNELASLFNRFGRFGGLHQTNFMKHEYVVKFKFLYRNSSHSQLLSQ